MRALAVAIPTAIAVAIAATPPVNAARDGDDLSFSYRRIEAGESQGHINVEVRRAATDALEESEAWFATADRSDATADVDYLSTEGRLRLGVGQTTAGLTVFLHGDDEEETRETFVVRLFPSRHSERVLDEVEVVIVDDDTPAAGAIEAAERSTSAGASAAGTRPSSGGQSYGSAQPVPRVVSRPRPARATAAGKKTAAAKVTPFELQPPAGQGAERLPAPAHTTPTAAAGLLAALLLGRVTAELWFRWRIDEA